MINIIIDSNIVFAGLLSKQSKIREVLSNNHFQFYAPKFLLVEIFRHKEKILSKSKSNEDDIYELLNLILHYINFVDEDFISTRNYILAFQLCKGVDEKDTPFIALALEMNCSLWTRDKELMEGLATKGFNNFFKENEF